MSLARVLGGVLLVAGLIVLVSAFQGSESVVGEVKKLVTGDFRDGTSWMIVGAVVACILGLVAVARPRRRFVGIE
jgi:uncharacterized membrane protein HdeD (DUF308 family)